MFRKKRSTKRSKEKGGARNGFIREGMEYGGDAHGPASNGHGRSEPDEEQDEHEFTEELRYRLDEETEEIQERGRAFNVAGNDEARPATEDEAADKVNTIWRQRLEDDPKGAVNDLRAMVQELGYDLAYAGRTFGEPVATRTYHIVKPDERERIAPFQDGGVDLTLLEVCLWSEVAFKRWKDS
jgi:hypothetical protein